MAENVEFESFCKLELEARDKEIADLKAKLKEVLLDSETQAMSRTDIVAQELVEARVKTKNGHFEIPVPLKLDFKLPNNFGLASDRVAAIKKKALKQPDLCQFLVESMTVLQSKGYIEDGSEVSAKSGRE